jgi:hypothetical protein
MVPKDKILRGTDERESRRDQNMALTEIRCRPPRRSTLLKA